MVENMPANVSGQAPGVYGTGSPVRTTPGNASRKLGYYAAAARYALGAIMLWAFADKTFGLGYATPVSRAWINGGSPTRGFLSGTDGPAAQFFQAIAGNVVVDWLFMIGLLAIGLALVFGIGMRIAGWSGALMMALMWAAVMPAATNPILDDHVVYAIVFLAFAAFPQAGEALGMGKWWSSTKVVERFPVLR